MKDDDEIELTPAQADLLCYVVDTYGKEPFKMDECIHGLMKWNKDHPNKSYVEFSKKRAAYRRLLEGDENES